MYAGRASFQRRPRSDLRMSALRVAVLAVVVVLAGGLGGFPFHHSQSPQPNSDPNEVTASITVTATADYGYQPDTFQQIPVDANISVTFSDMDVLPHSFTISSREGFVIPTTDTPTQLSALFTAYPAIYSVLLGGMGDQYAWDVPVAGGFGTVRVRLQCVGPLSGRDVRVHRVRGEPSVQPNAPDPHGTRRGLHYPAPGRNRGCGRRGGHPGYDLLDYSPRAAAVPFLYGSPAPPCFEYDSAGFARSRTPIVEPQPRGPWSAVLLQVVGPAHPVRSASQRIDG